MQVLNKYFQLTTDIKNQKAKYVFMDLESMFLTTSKAKNKQNQTISVLNGSL